MCRGGFRLFCYHLPASSPLRVPEYPLQGPLRPRSGLEEDFTALRDTCQVLRGSQLSWEERAQRAWRAGCWARAVLQAQSESPNHSVGLGIANRVYIAAEGLERPTVVHSFAAYKALVGHLQRGGSISHAFPSEADARLYFARARVDYPSA